MKKSLNQRTICNSWFLATISCAASNLDRLSQGLSADLTSAKEIIGLLAETLEASTTANTITPVGSSEWYYALTTKLIPEIYGIKRGESYKKERFEAGLALVLEQFQDLEKARGAKLEFTRHIMCRLGEGILKERNSWYRQPYYRRGLAAA